MQRCLVFLLLLFTPFFAGAQSVPVSPTTPYHTEEEWIVSTICRNIFEILSYTKDKKGESISPDHVTLNKFPGDFLAYDVVVQGAHVSVKATLRWPGSIWAASAYLPFCEAVAHELKLDPAPVPTEQGDPLNALLPFSESAIEAENQRVSQWMTAQPGDAGAQEQAALIAGTLALKENSGTFWDPRDATNHACAHLAVAQFLRSTQINGASSSSVEGGLADCLIGIIAGTKTETAQKLDKFDAGEKNSPDLAAWLGALRMHNTHDWRTAREPEKASAFEQVEYYQSMAEAISTDRAIEWFKGHQGQPAPDLPDWGRIVLQYRFSVGTGHFFATPSIDRELQVMRKTFPGHFQDAHLVSDLNESPGNVLDRQAGTLSVINRGMWAQFFQRHLCHAIFVTSGFFANLWGVPEQASQLDEMVGKNYSGLTYYPWLQLDIQRIRVSAPSPDRKAAQDLFLAHPEWAPPFLTRIPAAAPPDVFPLAVLNWFKPRILPGTNFDTGNRLASVPPEQAEVDQMYAVAPLSYGAAYYKLDSLYAGHFTYAQAKTVMGPLLDYYMPALKQARLAYDLDTDTKIDLAQKGAVIDPSEYKDLAELYIANHQEDKAADAYESWFELDSNRVAVSNGLQWLVNYDEDHGKPDKATELAKFAADIYSYLGLETMMKLMEKRGHLSEAEDYAQKINKRYDNNTVLIAFYKRHLDQGDPGFKDKMDRLIATTFPAGLKQVSLASFSGPPNRGIKFVKTTDTMQGNGFSSDDIVVALDGYAVENDAQYLFIRSFSDSPAMKLIVWNGQAYREIDATVPSRRFGTDTQDYHR